MKNTLFSKFHLGEAINLLVIGLFGFILIGHFLTGEYLVTHYADWLYHAFRIRSILTYDFVAWDHIWSNGMNYWHGYQFIPHLFSVILVSITGLSVTKSMIYVTMAVFFIHRICLYLIIRSQGVSRFPALFITLASYAFAQEWGTMKDYSLYIGTIILPICIWIWMKGMQDFRFMIIFAALAGFSFQFHPIVGYSMAFLLFFTLLISFSSIQKKRAYMAFGIFVLASSPFTLAYIVSGYRFVNPTLESLYFLKLIILEKNYGLSITLLIFFAFSWIMTFIKTSSIERWPRLLLLYTTLYLLVIVLARNGYMPLFINKLQITRAVIVLGFIIPYIAALHVETIMQKVKSRFFYTIITVILAITLTEAIDVSSAISALPAKTSDNAVAKYVNLHPDLKGSIFIDDVVSATYFTRPPVRFATSYNQHAEPHPHAQRLGRLLKNDFSFTGISNKQIRLINDYAQVLGIEYIFVPDFSPLAKLNLQEKSSDFLFEKVANVRTANGTFAVLKNKNSIHYAYVGNLSDKQLIKLEPVDDPTIRSDSYKAWDNEISNLANLMNKKIIKPVPMQFIYPDTLAIDVSKITDMKNKFILVTQSYHSGWKAKDSSPIIQSTGMHFLYLTTPAAEKIVLKNEWPLWYWPVQSIGLITLISVVIWQLLFTKITPRKIISLER